jgi:sarcinarray family protein
VDANQPVENEYGLCSCWFSRDGSTWYEATVDLVKLRLGERFFIKTLISTNQDLNVMSICLSGLGESSDFEVINGPCNLSETCHVWKPMKNETHVYVWELRVRPDTKWVNGNSPLNIDVCFTKNGNHNLPPFTIVNVYILEDFCEEYEKHLQNEKYSPTINHTSRSTPGFPLFLLIFGIGSLLIWKRHWKT